ncbi:putative ankyrin repeat protein RBE_0997 [Lucilia sericata]|uniref:putative ankyrin repeat protein RBE_0997 n=1 Tax=Lucilia sericata TaxID=13632 RepID=UPI0018A8262E|nr:putative ankyrin repeat protein RBE_0997 [Lucilia sericata]
MKNEEKDTFTSTNDKEPTKLTEDNSSNKDIGDIKNEFNVRILKETNNSITLEWNLISETDVYEIEVHHKVKGWQNVDWTSKCLTTVTNLDENFGYILRVKALKLNAAEGAYRPLKISPNIVGCTLAAEPTAICLFRAIKKDQQFLVKRILRHRPILIEYPGPNGYLPLANAIAFSEMCIVDVILTYGASVHVGNTNNKRTPLHQAFYYGRLPVARMLLNKKANMEAKDIYGLTASHLAVDANQGEILKFALENGANIEARDACGWTLLMRAVIMASDLSILKLLVICGADMESKDMNNLNCLDLARLYGNDKAADYFEKVLTLKKEKELQSKYEKDK